MNDLAIIKTSDLQNKALVVQLSNINKAVSSVLKSRWATADAIKTIMEGCLFEQDFENESAFAEFLGMSRPNLNKLKRASIYKDFAGLGAFDVSKVMELLTIPKDDLIKFIEENAIGTENTVSEIRNFVKIYNEGIAGEEVEVVEDEQVGEEKEIKTDETVESVEIPAGFVKISFKTDDWEYEGIINIEILNEIKKMIK